MRKAAAMALVVFSFVHRLQGWLLKHGLSMLKQDLLRRHSPRTIEG